MVAGNDGLVAGNDICLGGGNGLILNSFPLKLLNSDTTRVLKYWREEKGLDFEGIYRSLVSSIFKVNDSNVLVYLDDFFSIF